VSEIISSGDPEIIISTNFRGLDADANRVLITDHTSSRFIIME